MPTPSERFQSLGNQFDSLVEKLNASPPPGLKERTQILRQMKVLIVEIDMLILSALKWDAQGTPNSIPRDQPTAES